MHMPAFANDEAFNTEAWGKPKGAVIEPQIQAASISALAWSLLLTRMIGACDGNHVLEHCAVLIIFV